MIAGLVMGLTQLADQILIHKNADFR